MIPEAAVEAAFQSMWGPSPSNPSDSGDAHLLTQLRDALEAAAPHMLNLAKREAWDANLEIQRLRAELAKLSALRPYTVEDQRQHGETW